MEASWWIVIIVIIVIIILLGVLVPLLLKRRTEGKRLQAAQLREEAGPQKHAVAQKEAQADQVAASADEARAEADRKNAEAAELEHEAQRRASDAEKERSAYTDTRREADKMDPDVPTDREGRRTDEPSDSSRAPHDGGAVHEDRNDVEPQTDQSAATGQTGTGQPTAGQPQADPHSYTTGQSAAEEPAAQQRDNTTQPTTGQPQRETEPDDNIGKSPASYPDDGHGQEPAPAGGRHAARAADPADPEDAADTSWTDRLKSEGKGFKNRFNKH